MLGHDRYHLLEVVHGVHGSISLGLAGETNETEATATLGVAILNDGLYRDNAKSE